MAEFVQQQLRWPLMTSLESFRAIALGRVVDKTGLDGKYDFTLEYAGRRNSPRWGVSASRCLTARATRLHS